MLVLWERFLGNNVLLQSMTFGWQDLDVLVHVEKTRHFKTRKGPSRKDGFEGIQKLAQCWKSKLRITIEIEIDSMKNDGSQFGTVISRRDEQIRNQASRRERDIHSWRRSGRQYGETRCDKTEGTIQSMIILILDECYAGRSTEVK